MFIFLMFIVAVYSLRYILRRVTSTVYKDRKRVLNAKIMLPYSCLKHFTEVKDAVEPIMYLLSDKSAMVNGATFAVDGGWTAC